MNLVSLCFQIALWPVPWPIRRRLLCWILGFRLASDCRIGMSVVLAQHVNLGSGSRIGHFTMVRNLSRIVLEDEAQLGNFNRVAGVLPMSSGPFSDEPDRKPELVLHRHSAITHSHLIDCTNSVTIGAFATLAGWQTQILTHAIDVSANRQRSAPVSIGSYCFVGTGCILLKGASLPERSILAAGSVLGAGGDRVPNALYSGVPAVPAKELDPGAKYFVRNVGAVD